MHCETLPVECSSRIISYLSSRYLVSIQNCAPNKKSEGLRALETIHRDWRDEGARAQTDKQSW
jgi:hypothetical protein